MKPKPPPALIPPETPQKTPEHERKETEEKQLRMSYGFVFGGDHGRRVLADLKANFGWDGDIERASAIPGLRSEEVWLREGCKQPVRHILSKLQRIENEPQPKPTTATQ